MITQEELLTEIVNTDKDEMALQVLGDPNLKNNMEALVNEIKEEYSKLEKK